MPELPEVETSRRGIEPHIIGTRISRVVIRNRSLRWPISKSVDRNLTDSTIASVTRRAKYLLINTEQGAAILHLGMSGSVFVVDSDTPAEAFGWPVKSQTKIDKFRWQTHCRGLYQLPEAA